MKEEPEWLQEPMGSPEVHFEKDVYLRSVGFVTMKAKFTNAVGTTCLIIDPYSEIVASMDVSKFTLGYLSYWASWNDPEGIFRTELRQNGVVVASDTAELKNAPTCSLGEKFCLFGDLWRCINGKMQEYEKKSPACTRAGFSNTGYTVPDVLRLQEGTWDIMITKEWHVDKIYRGVKIEKGKTTSLISILASKPKGNLSCMCTPKGARVWMKKR